MHIYRSTVYYPINWELQISHSNPIVPRQQIHEVMHGFFCFSVRYVCLNPPKCLVITPAVFPVVPARTMWSCKPAELGTPKLQTSAEGLIDCCLAKQRLDLVTLPGPRREGGTCTTGLERDASHPFPSKPIRTSSESPDPHQCCETQRGQPRATKAVSATPCS